MEIIESTFNKMAPKILLICCILWRESEIFIIVIPCSACVLSYPVFWQSKGQGAGFSPRTKQDCALVCSSLFLQPPPSSWGRQGCLCSMKPREAPQLLHGTRAAGVVCSHRACWSTGTGGSAPPAAPPDPAWGSHTTRQGDAAPQPGTSLPPHLSHSCEQEPTPPPEIHLTEQFPDAVAGQASTDTTCFFPGQAFWQYLRRKPSEWSVNMLCHFLQVYRQSYPKEMNVSWMQFSQGKMFLFWAGNVLKAVHWN